MPKVERSSKYLNSSLVCTASTLCSVTSFSTNRNSDLNMYILMRITEALKPIGMPRLSGVKRVVLRCYEYGRRGLMRIKLYQPDTASERELRMTPCQRQVLLGSDADDWRNWVEKLIRRLSFRRRGSVGKGVHLNQTILRTAKKLGGIRYCVVVSLDEGDHTGHGVRLAALHSMTQREYAVVLKNEEVGRALGRTDVEDPVRDALCGPGTKRDKRARLDTLLAGLHMDKKKDVLIYESRSRSSSGADEVIKKVGKGRDRPKNMDPVIIFT